MYYIIFSGEDDFIVLGCVKGSREDAWDFANDTYENYLDEGTHYDVLGEFTRPDDLYYEIKKNSSESQLSDNLRMIDDFLNGRQL
jgi:hypothetical protein